MVQPCSSLTSQPCSTLNITTMFHPCAITMFHHYITTMLPPSIPFSSLVPQPFFSLTLTRLPTPYATVIFHTSQISFHMLTCLQHHKLNVKCNTYVAVISNLITNSFSKYDTCQNMGVHTEQLCSCSICSWFVFFFHCVCCYTQHSQAYLQLVRGNGYAPSIA